MVRNLLGSLLLDDHQSNRYALETVILQTVKRPETVSHPVFMPVVLGYTYVRRSCGRANGTIPFSAPNQNLLSLLLILSPPSLSSLSLNQNLLIKLLLQDQRLFVGLLFIPCNNLSFILLLLLLQLLQLLLQPPWASYVHRVKA